MVQWRNEATVEYMMHSLDHDLLGSEPLQRMKLPFKYVKGHYIYAFILIG